MSLRLRDLEPATYVPHSTHSGERVWPESNCYVDVWIELLHSRGLEPLACLPFTLGVDHEGDQWTFFKFPLADLRTLYGLEVVELNVWRPLVAHIEEQLGLGRPVIVEADAWFLPDTRGTSYRSEHVKTSIGIQMIDPAANRLGYFHNAGYYELEGEDFVGTFRLEGHLTDPEFLPPYVEVAKPGVQAPLEGGGLFAASVALLRAHLGRLPAANPFRTYAARFPRDMAWLSEASLETFHRYAFSGLRQCGASFELAAMYLRWLGARGETGLGPAIDAFDAISGAAKDLQFKTARFVNTRRPFDPAPLLDTMAMAWDTGTRSLTSIYRI